MGQSFHEVANKRSTILGSLCVLFYYILNFRRCCYVDFYKYYECREQDIQRSTEKQQELDQQQTQDLIGGFPKLSDPFSSSAGPGTKITYGQDLRPNGGTNQQIPSSSQYHHHTLSTSSILSITNASAIRTTAAPYSYSSFPNTTIGSTSLGNVVPSENATTTAYNTDIASMQVRP